MLKTKPQKKRIFVLATCFLIVALISLSVVNVARAGGGGGDTFNTIADGYSSAISTTLPNAVLASDLNTGNWSGFTFSGANTLVVDFSSLSIPSGSTFFVNFNWNISDAGEGDLFLVLNAPDAGDSTLSVRSGMTTTNVYYFTSGVNCSLEIDNQQLTFKSDNVADGDPCHTVATAISDVEFCGGQGIGFTGYLSFGNSLNSPSPSPSPSPTATATPTATDTWRPHGGNSDQSQGLQINVPEIVLILAVGVGAFTLLRGKKK